MDRQTLEKVVLLSTGENKYQSDEQTEIRTEPVKVAKKPLVSTWLIRY